MNLHSPSLLVVIALFGMSGSAGAADGNNPTGNSTPVPTPTNNMFANPLNQPVRPATSPFFRYGVSPYYRGSGGVPTQRQR